MRHVLIICTIFILFGTGSFIGGYYYHERTAEPTIKILTETKWKESIIYRDYTTLPTEEAISKLKCYDQGEIKITVKPIDVGTFRINTSLCERSAYKDFEVECGESGNWKFYAGLGIATAAGVGLFTLLH